MPDKPCWTERSMDTKWLTVIEAAEYLKLGRSTVYRLVREGKLPAHKFGRHWRFDAAEQGHRRKG